MEKKTKALQCDLCQCFGTKDNGIETYSNEHDAGLICEACIDHYQGKYCDEPCEEECD